MTYGLRPRVPSEDGPAVRPADDEAKRSTAR